MRRFKMFLAALAAGLFAVGMLAGPASASPRHHHHHVKPVLATRVSVLQYSTRAVGSSRMAVFTGRMGTVCGRRLVDWSYNDRVKLFENGRQIMSSTLGQDGTFTLTDTSNLKGSNYVVVFGGRPASYTHYGLRPSTVSVSAAELALTHR